MSARRFPRKRELPPLSSRPQDDDAGLLFGTSFSGTSDRKTEQLCQQVHDALSLALADSRDPSVRECVLVAVTPHPGPNQLRVRVIPDAGDSVEELSAALARAHGHLRREVAAYVHRRRAPELRFIVAPRGGGER